MLARLAAGYLGRSLGRIVATLDGLDPDEQRWRPPAPQTNSLLGIAAHALANTEENVAGVLCGRPVARSAASEFESISTEDDVRARWKDLEPRIASLLAELPDERLTSQVQHPRRGGLTGFEVLLVAVRHAAEHMGQAELTRDLLLARRQERAHT